MAEAADALSFEDALRELESVVRQLESGDATLERSIELYVRGEQLRGQCEARLREAQLKIEQLQLGADGKPQGVRPFDGE